MVEGFYIINKSGGLVYTTDRRTEANTLMVTASSIQSLNEITRNCLSTDHFFQEVAYETKRMHIFRTITGFTFIFITSGSARNSLESVYKHVYRHFCEFVLADPFYSLEMPIASQKFHPENYFNSSPRAGQTADTGS